MKPDGVILPNASASADRLQPADLGSIPASQADFQALQHQLQECRDRLAAVEVQYNQLSAMVDAMPHIMWAADSNGSFIYVNQQWCQQTNLAMEDFAQSGFLGAVHPAEKERVVREWRNAVNQKKPYRASVRLRRANGTYQWYALQARPMNLQQVSERNRDDQAGKASDGPSLTSSQSELSASGAPPTPKDIWVGSLSQSQRPKDVEVSLLEEEEFLKAVLSHLSDGIVACDSDGMLTLLNRAAQEFHHVPYQALPADEWVKSYGLYHADGKTPMAMNEVPLYRALNGESVRDVEMHIVPPQGETRIVLASGDAIISSEGKKLGAVVAMKDITQRKQAEAALRSLNADLEERVHERTLALEQSYQELQQEVDARKQVEQRLLEQNQVLMQQNLELKRQRQYIQQQNIRLTEASRLKSQFLATMSHELRTPMNAIIGFSQLLLRQRKTPLPPQMEEMVKRILNNGKKLLVMVNELLDFSKAEAGKLDLRPQRFDLKLMMTTTLDELRSLAEQKRLDLYLDIQLSHPHVINDPGRLRQILVNLLSNAIKFTEQGYVRLSVCERQVVQAESEAQAMSQPSEGQQSEEQGDDEQNGDRLIFLVEDTGIGMDPETINTIFEPFRQLDQSNTRKYSGTGLGLAIVDSLVQLMGGTVSVESQPGCGTQFRVELPRWVTGI